ncbi:hypothetical protein ACJX0J_009842, partial [Zea mays]
MIDRSLFFSCFYLIIFPFGSILNEPGFVERLNMDNLINLRDLQLDKDSNIVEYQHIPNLSVIVRRRVEYHIHVLKSVAYLFLNNIKGQTDLSKLDVEQQGDDLVLHHVILGAASPWMLSQIAATTSEKTSFIPLNTTTSSSVMGTLLEQKNVKEFELKLEKEIFKLEQVRKMEGLMT